jgi:hypothetical protein
MNEELIHRRLFYGMYAMGREEGDRGREGRGNWASN